MRRRSKRLRRVELALWAAGLGLLAFALAATAERWSYQAAQERAFVQAAYPELRSAAGMETPRRGRAVMPADMFGPVPAPNSIPVIPKRNPKAGPPAETKAPAEPKPAKRREPGLDPAAVGRIEIPRIGVRAVIRRGADDETLGRAVGLLPHSAVPGEPGNVVLAAHRDTFFRPLRKIRKADRIRLVLPPDEYVYEVETMRVVSPQETSVLQSRGAEELTLVTCHPFGFIGAAPDRFIVNAKRVSAKHMQ